MDKVSVIIATYNRARKLLDSVNSVLRQTYANIEIIIVDDGSNDNTRELVATITDERVKYIKLEKNSGAAYARNVGVKYAQGEIIAFEDSDDFWRPDKLEKQMQYWTENPQFAMIYCAYYMHEPEQTRKIPDKDWNVELEGEIFQWILLCNTIGTPTMLMKKNCFLEIGGFDTTMRSLEDWDFAIRFSERFLIGYVEEALVDAYYSEGGVSSGVGAYYENRCKMISEYKEQLITYGIFDIAVKDLFQKAQQRNCLETVKQMLMIFLSNKK